MDSVPNYRVAGSHPIKAKTLARHLAQALLRSFMRAANFAKAVARLFGLNVPVGVESGLSAFRPTEDEAATRSLEQLRH